MKKKKKKKEAKVILKRERFGFLIKFWCFLLPRNHVREHRNQRTLIHILFDERL